MSMIVGVITIFYVIDTRVNMTKQIDSEIQNSMRSSIKIIDDYIDHKVDYATQNISDGIDGQDGKDGNNGRDGYDGSNGIDGTNGSNGSNGINGENGQDGKDGEDGKTIQIRCNVKKNRWEVKYVSDDIWQVMNGEIVPCVGVSNNKGE